MKKADGEKRREGKKGMQNSTVYVDKIVKVESRKPVQIVQESSDDEYLKQKFKKAKNK